MKRWILGTLLAASLTPAAFAEGSGPAAFMGEWRIVRVQAFPQANAEAAGASLSTGARVRLRADGMDAPPPLGCDSAQLDLLSVPAEGLFQGTLTHPPADAEQLGVALPAPTLRIDCSSGSWDLHAADPDTLMFALDRHVYTLSRSAGTRAQAGTPEYAVQALLEAHFAGSMGFDPAHWQGLEAWLSQPLKASLQSYRETPWPTDEVPPIHGDPLTDSQEYPTRFRVGAAQQMGDLAELEVAFADAYSQRRLRYRLVREQTDWRLDDVLFDAGGGLRALLAERP